MERILAAVDFSPVSNQLIEQAVSLARVFSAELILLHAAAPDPDFVGYEAGPQTVRDSRAHELRDEHRDLQRRAEALRGEGLAVESFLIQGPAREVILERASHFAVDLIVIGSHGHGALYRTLVGSVSEGVLRRATCPVLVVPARPSEA